MLTEFNPVVNESELDTIEETAAWLKVPKSWLYAHTRQTGPGSIPRIKVGRYLRFERAAVRKWLEKTYGE